MSAPLSLSVLSRRRWVVFVLAPLTAIAIITLVTLTARAWRDKTGSAARQNIAAQPTPARGRSQIKLALQPEADKQRRRLGQRFLAPGREVATLIGMVTVGADRQTVRIVRSQDEDDERLTIALGGGPPTLTWSGLEGAKSNGSPATGSGRSLIERIALDSPDQFVLAQLRGAAYFTVARSVRPAEAGGSGNYTGPVWDLVRVAEPTRIGQNKPQSLWRLYHINSSTGLIDKVVSQEQGQTITAEISGWVNQNGETIPARTVWKLNGQTIMELSLTNVTHNPKQ
jgi:hypothetical protein